MQLGTAHGAVICPWDVPDVEHVPDQKVEFLLALHALLIGEAHDAEGLVRTLDADEEALLRDAITAVYKRCANSRERPREQLLIDALHDRQQRRAADRRERRQAAVAAAAPRPLRPGRDARAHRRPAHHGRRERAAGALRLHRPV